MSKVEEPLFKLIHSLTKSEKRYFSLHAARHTIGQENNTLRLFKKLEGAKHYNEKKFLARHAHEGFVKHYRFNKHFLYKLILESLHAFHAGKTAEAEIRERLHYIDILTEKGLFDQALELIYSAKEKARKYQYHELLLELIHKETSLHREQSFSAISAEQIEALFSEYNHTLKDLQAVATQEKVAIRISQRISKAGFARDKDSMDELLKVKSNADLQKVPSQFQAAWHFYISRTAIDFMHRDHTSALEGTNALIELVEQHPHMIKEAPKAYISVLHNKIVLLANLRRYKEVPGVAEKIESVPVRTQIMKNRQFFSANNLLISMYPQTAEFEKGLAHLKRMEEKLASGEVQFLNVQHRITYTFSAAHLHFGAGNFAACNKFLQEIIDGGEASPRSDIVAYARIMRMIVQFETGKQDLLEYTVRSVYRFLYKRKRIYKFEDSILRFIRKKAPHIDSPKAMMEAFTELHAELLPLTKDPYEKNAFAYFDMMSWLESKINGVTFAEIIREKAKSYN